MNDLKRQLRVEAERIEPARDGFERTLARVGRIRRRERLLAGGVAFVFAGFVVGTAMVMLRHQSVAPPPVRPGTQTASPAETTLSGSAVAAALSDGDIWVVTCDPCGAIRAGDVGHVDAASGRVLTSTAVQAPYGLAVAEQAVWVISGDASLIRIDPANGQVTSTTQLQLPEALDPGDGRFLPLAVAAGEGAVWVTSGRGALARIAPATNEVSGVTSLPGDTTGSVVVGEGRVVVAENVLGIFGIDPMTGDVTSRVPIARGDERLAVDSIAAGGGSIWVTGNWTRPNPGQSTPDYIDWTPTGEAGLVRLDPRTLAPLEFYPYDEHQRIFYQERAVWAVSANDRAVSRTDPETGQVSAPVTIPPSQHFLGVAAREILTLDEEGNLHRIPAPSS